MANKIKLYAYDGGATANESHRIAIVIDEKGKEVLRTPAEDERGMPKAVGITGTAHHDLYNEAYGQGGWELEFVTSLGDVKSTETAPSSIKLSHEGLANALAARKKAEGK